MIDVNIPAGLDLHVKTDGKTVWVCDMETGETYFRIQAVNKIVYTDERDYPSSENLEKLVLNELEGHLRIEALDGPANDLPNHAIFGAPNAAKSIAHKVMVMIRIQEELQESCIHWGWAENNGICKECGKLVES